MLYKTLSKNGLSSLTSQCITLLTNIKLSVLSIHCKMLIDYRKRIRPFLKRLNSHFKKILYIVSQVSIKVIYQFISSYVLSIQIIKFSIRKWILNLINTVDQFSYTLDHIKEKRHKNSHKILRDKSTIPSFLKQRRDREE